MQNSGVQKRLKNLNSPNRLEKLRAALQSPEYREKKRQEIKSRMDAGWSPQWSNESRQKQRERKTGCVASVETRLKQSASIKKAWSEGRIVSTGPLDRVKAKANGLKSYARNKEKLRDGLQKAKEDGKLKWSEERKSMEGFRADETHIRARVWRLRSPKNVTFGPFKNLAFFIRNHRHLFLPEDAVEPVLKGRAYSGLCRLNPNGKSKAVSGSWKGWTWCSQLERLQNGGNDLLDRTYTPDITESHASSNSPNSPAASPASRPLV